MRSKWQQTAGWDDRRQAPFSLQGALLAVPPLWMLLLLKLSGHYPVVVELVEPSVVTGPCDALPFPAMKIMNKIQLLGIVRYHTGGSMKLNACFLHLAQMVY